MAKIVPIENASDVSEAYIKNVMHQHYNNEITSDITPLFLKTFVHDYKQKARNLDWLFKGKTTITIQPDAEKILADLIRDDAYGIKILLDFLKSIGATYTAEQLQDSKCTWQKQEMRINRVIQQNSDNDIIKAIMAKDKYSGKVNRTFTVVGVAYVDSVTDTVHIKQNMSSHGNSASDVTDGTHIWVRSGGAHLYECIAESQSEMVVRKNINDINLTDTLTQIDAGTVIMSIEINDFITASSGGVNSCFGFGGMHHLGWMNYWRADFGIMVYMQNKSDRFSKVGRQWLLMKMTENGQDFEAPAFKFQNAYGRIKKSHTDLVTQHILAEVERKWGYKREDFVKITSGGLNAVIVSDTCMSEGGSHGRHSGFTDSSFSDRAPGFMLKEDKAYKGQYLAFQGFGEGSKYQDGRSLIFNFPDAINPKGIVTNSGNFQGNQTNRKNSSTGYIPPARLVTCAATGDTVLDKECTMMPDGSWIQTDILIRSFDPEAIPAAPTKVVVEEVIAEEKLSDEELQFDEDEF